MARTRSRTRRCARSNPRGVLSVRSGGFGFVRASEGEFFIPASKMAGAFDGDLVEVAPLPVQDKRGGKSRCDEPHCNRKGDQPAARVVRVIDRACETLIGRYEVAEPFGVVVPEDTRIPYDVFTMRADSSDVEDGSLVRVRITTFPTRNTAATGVVEEVFGRTDGEHAMIDALIGRYKLETSFSEGALAEAQAAVLDEAGALAAGYRDIRDRFVFTVDPADARDFDDALSIEAVRACDIACGAHVVNAGVCKAAAWRLGVHIADVSHYVAWDSSLDLDARRRATSVYLVDRVIAMLPAELSDDLCSLKPGELRRSMTVDLYLDDRARLVAYEVYPALIRSDVRLSYDEAQRLLDRPTGDGVSWRLGVLLGLAKERAAARRLAGGLDFDSSEARVRLDEEGRPVGIDVRVKTDATSLVEEAMIYANETVAAHMSEARFPSLYRVHEQPLPDNLFELVAVLQEFTWFDAIDTDAFVSGDAHAVQQVLEASKGRPECELVSSLVLRCMKRALYRPSIGDHYGLASGAYTHFTSPIRRYPDLMVHRMLKAQLAGCSEKLDREISALSWIAEHASDMERVAEKAARESQEIKIIEYMESFVGRPFSATVSGVASCGVYVRLDNTAEGLIAAKDLGDECFVLDAVRHLLVGQDTGTLYRLGQRVAVVLTAADPRARRLNFRIAPCT